MSMEKLVELRQLEYFCAVGRLGSYRLAAEECHVSQSAISQQVKALETELGAPLTERRGRGFVLTPAGTRLARGGQGILEDIARLVREVRDGEKAPTELRVGYLNRYMGWEVQAAIAAFARRHPKVVVTARSADHEALYEGVLDGTYDVLVNDRRRELSDEFENLPLFSGYAYVEVSEASELAWRECVTVPDLAGLSCILVSEGERREAERVYWRDVLNFDCDFVFAENLEEAHMLVAGNRGFLPLEVREPNGRTGGVLRSIPLCDATGAQRRRDYYAFWPKARANRLVEEFADILGGLF